MVIGDITQKIKENSQVIGYGAGLYILTYPAYYNDGTPITIAFKIENETDVVLERGEEVENMGLLSTSDEYTIMDLGSVVERYANVDGIDSIINNSCAKYHLKYSKNIISLDADVETTLSKLNRYVKCMFEIEMKVEEKLGVEHKREQSKSTGASEQLMAYLNKKGN